MVLEDIPRVPDEGKIWVWVEFPAGSVAEYSPPMPGMVVRFEKKVGDAVKKGDTIMILEAMKMENALVAPCDGSINAVNFSVGDSVVKGATLAVIG